jgi:hypothetical protein
MRCQVAGHIEAHPKWILYNCALSSCFLAYCNFSYWFIVYCMAGVFVFWDLGLSLLIFTLPSVAVSCLALNVLLNHTAVLFIYSIIWCSCSGWFVWLVLCHIAWYFSAHSSILITYYLPTSCSNYYLFIKHYVTNQQKPTHNLLPTVSSHSHSAPTDHHELS